MTDGDRVLRLLREIRGCMDGRGQALARLDEGLARLQARRNEIVAAVARARGDGCVPMEGSE